MKKVFGIVILAVIGMGVGLGLTINKPDEQSVGKQDNAIVEKYNNEPSDLNVSEENEVDIVDLTELNSTMLYAEVYNMMMYPETYEGKMIKMKGEFITFDNPETNEITTACLIMDATACCAQGIEFVLENEKADSYNYPEVNSEIIVSGIYRTYEQKGQLYCHLVDATLE